VRITVGGNLINYPGELTTNTADLITSKILWNSVLSTPNAKYMTVDIKNFYLNTPLDRYEYMRIPLTLIPQHMIDQHDLTSKAKGGFVYCEIQKGIYGLPQAGILANKLLKKRLAKFGYYEVTHTPGLWRHIWRPIQFTLVVDDFGVKYIGKQHAEHLCKVLRTEYTIATDWTGGLYCGITLNWNYTKRHLDVSMPGYIKTQLQKYKHLPPPKPQNCPYRPQPKKYGKAAQDVITEDESKPVDDKRKKQIQKIVGSILWYARAVNLTVLMALSTIAGEQSKATENTEDTVEQLLDYLASHPNATIQYRASDMILNIHSDASYLSESKARSRACGHYFLGWVPKDGEPIKLNGAIFTLCNVLKWVVASAAEAELGALFLNCKEGKVMRTILEEMGHTQPATPVHCNNATAVGIANKTIKRLRSKSMEMRFFWIVDQAKWGRFAIRWHPGLENLGDYQSKHHVGAHHSNVRPWYLHMKNSPWLLPWALAPRSMRGCVGSSHGYQGHAPLPRVRVMDRASGPTNRQRRTDGRQ